MERNSSEATISRDNALEIVNSQISIHSNIRSTAQSTLRLILATGAIAASIISSGFQIIYDIDPQGIRASAEAIGAPPQGIRGTVEIYEWPVFFVIVTIAGISLIASCWKFLQVSRGESHLQPGLGGKENFDVKIQDNPQQTATGRQLLKARATDKLYTKWISHNSNTIFNERESLQEGFIYLTVSILCGSLGASLFNLMANAAIPFIIYVNIVLLSPVASLLAYPLSVIYSLVIDRSLQAMGNRLKQVWKTQVNTIFHYLPGNSSGALIFYISLYIVLAMFAFEVVRYYLPFMSFL